MRRTPWSPIFDVPRSVGEISVGVTPSAVVIPTPTINDWEEWSYSGGWLQQDTAGMNFGADTYSAAHQNSFDAPGALLYKPGGAAFAFPTDMFAQLAAAASSHGAFGNNLGSGFGVAVRVADDCSSFLCAVIREASSGAVQDQMQLQSVVGNTVTVLDNVAGGSVNSTSNLRCWVVGDTAYATCDAYPGTTLSSTGANAFTGLNVAVVKTGGGDADSPNSSGNTFTAGSA